MKAKYIILAVMLCLITQGARGNSGQLEAKWVASWTTPISSALTKTDYLSEAGYSKETIAVLKGLPEFNQREFDALPGGEASDQSFRMIVKPDLWGDTVRVRLSNVFGSRDISLATATIGLQEYGANLVQGTNTPVTFNGKSRVVIPRGQEVLSDPMHLDFVTRENKKWLAGRSLAVSFAVIGKSGSLSVHGAKVNSYISASNSGDHTRDEDSSSFPYVTNSFFLVKELDVLAAADTAVVCALGDSITDGGMTIDGYDGWSDDLSIRAHRIFGDKVSVINMGISGNTVAAVLPGGSDPVVKRLDRDVLGVAGLTSVVLLEGINDLGSGQSKPDPIIEGYREVVARLHSRGVRVIGATITSSLRPEPYDEAIPKATRGEWDKYGSVQTDTYRKQVDEFIRSSGLFDSVADMEKATEDRSTGALYKHFQSGDYLHPNRAGHQAMAEEVDLKVLARPGSGNN